MIVVLLPSVSITVIDSLDREGSNGARVLCNGFQYVLNGSIFGFLALCVLFVQ
jgi:hypothetical protein